MAKITAYLDPIANTLNLWWGNKKNAYKSIPVDNPNRDDVIIVDKNNRPISLEIIGVFPEELDPIENLSQHQIKTFLDTGQINLTEYQLPTLPSKVSDSPKSK